ncbi:hypothetical protein [Kibdelosporangium aridum]|uniref:PE-PGRS family protein n=1 Tax=Kibdelosporangium aridum TaxID=2030 RepID=A0A1W2FX67_KIBAR|nr:hypothetical protein [Kibdelosporangium aridum]SMD26208.1 hypothetical protein SAMN05661093_09788 [Kibdelosporangium aridum]
MSEPKPLINRAELSKADMWRSRPVPGADVAIILLDKRGNLYESTRALTAGEIAWDTPKASFEVDISMHTTKFELQLPAAEEAFSFSAKIVAHWRVDDPREAVRSKLSDAEEVVKPTVEGQLREISRSYPIERNAAAEDAIRKHFTGRSVRLSHGLLLVACETTLQMDTSTHGHMASRTFAERARERLLSDHKTTTLDTTLTIELEQTKQLLEEQRATFAQRLAAKEEEHKLELLQKNIEFYAQALNAGSLNLVALRLAANPDEVKEVLNVLVEQRQLDFEGARGMLNSLLENHLVNKRDVADIMARATSVVADHMTRAPFEVDRSSRQDPARNGVVDPPALAAAPVTAEVVREQDEDDDFDDDDD